jgi:sn-glycerol 3-phosphate transport system substrate-binding protein
MSQFTRRSFIGLVGATGAAVGLSACAGSGGGGNGGGGGEEGDANRVIFWSNHPGTSKELELEIIEAYKEVVPDITVELIDAGKDYEEVAQKFNAALSGGGLPDVIVGSDVNWFNFALNGQFAKVNELWDAAEEFDKDDYVESLLGDYELDGDNFGIPFARSTVIFYYNKELWKQAGLPDRGPETWDEFAEWAPRLRDVLEGDARPIAMYNGANYLDWTIQNLLWEKDGGFSEEWDLTFTKPETISGLEYLVKLNDDDHLILSDDSIVEFSAGIAACAVASTGSISSVKEQANFEWGTAFLPGAADNDSCPTGGAGVAIPAGISDERKANAMNFIAFLTNPENTAKFAQGTGYMPVRKSATESEEVQAYLKETPQAKTAIDQLPHTRPQDYARVFVPNPGTRIGGALDKILAGSDITSTMEALQDETQNIIDTQIEPLLGN